MAFTVLLCTDGSELSSAALVDGVAVVAAPERIVLAMVVEPADPTLVVGAGIAGGMMPVAEAQRVYDERLAQAHALLVETAAALGLEGVEPMVVTGAPGRALCELAETLPASVVVMGTRGRGGLRRAVMGSVSDHVVRHAPCPVVTVGPK